MSAVLLFWLSHFYYFGRFLLEVFVLVVSLKTNFHSRNLQGKIYGYGKVQHELSNPGRVAGNGSRVEWCFEGCMDSSGLRYSLIFWNWHLVAMLRG